ncbi:hypothetical protein F4820DRAFT_441432 [Hypoxylon rubiginosum]|uniref:Uncharacterized protein n=1 Tax=Hypoxylon rubiginosum TaxID=110542 RepID=A0ACB9YIW2_9PEZI|nr:hypothetical protein F4820DRAFT_441432 [Hypoxylon rubiginosum]
MTGPSRPLDITWTLTTSARPKCLEPSCVPGSSLASKQGFPQVRNRSKPQHEDLVPLPSTSKFALRALADALVMEVRLYPDVPIEVHFIMPNYITTAGYDRENETKPEVTVQLEGADKPQDPDTVVRLSIAGIEKGRYFITTSFVRDLMRWSAMGNSPRDNWFVDTLMGLVLPFIMIFIVWDMHWWTKCWWTKCWWTKCRCTQSSHLP